MGNYSAHTISMHRIFVSSEFNCRAGISSDSIESLAASIDQDGLLFPVDVQPIEDVADAPKGFDYRLVCGFRRFTACTRLGWVEIPAIIRHGMSDRQAAIVNLTENLERQQLNILEEANSLEKLFPSYRTIRSIAKELHKSEKWVSLRRHLMLQAEFIQKAAASGRLSERDLRLIIHSSDPEAKARQILNAQKESNGKSSVTHFGKRTRNKSEIKELIARMLAEGFNPQLLRFLSWTAGEITDEELNEALTWLRDRKGWLK